MDVHDMAIERIAVEDLRADKSGVLIEQMGSLAYRAFREPPWNDDLERPRLHLGLGVDLMRRNAVAFIAKAQDSGKIAGYALGYEVFRESEDPRDVTLSTISGTTALDYLFEGPEPCVLRRYGLRGPRRSATADRLWTRGGGDPCA